MGSNAGKTVRAILQQKRSAIRRAALDPGAPGWDDILDLSWEEVEERAKRREPGFRTFRKLLTCKRFNK